MKKYLLSVFMCIAAFAASAQSQNESTVVLKSGLSITGTITERTSEGLTIKSSDGDIFIYRNDEIKNIVQPKGANKEAAGQALQKRADKYSYKGYKGIVEIGVGGNIDLGYGIPASTYTHATFTNGYQFGPHFYSGIGVGISISDFPLVSAPVFVDLRVHPLRYRKFSPYIGFKIGYQFNIKGYHDNSFDGDGCSSYYVTKYHWPQHRYFNCQHQHKLHGYYKYVIGTYKNNGLVAEPSLGLSCNLNKKNALNISIAFSFPNTIYGSPESIYKGEEEIYIEPLHDTYMCNHYILVSKPDRSDFDFVIMGKIGFTF